MDVRLTTIARAIGQDPAGVRGIVISRVSSSDRVTAVGGVRLARPIAVGTVSDPDFVGRLVG